MASQNAITISTIVCLIAASVAGLAARKHQSTMSYSNIQPHMASKISCPTTKCQCQAQPFSAIVDLHCPSTITQIPPFSNNALTLEWMYLLGTHIKRIHRDSFTNIKVRRLNLKSSNFGTKGAIGPEAFQWLQKELLQLVLADCSLREVPNQSLTLPWLQQLDLSRNKIHLLRRSCMKGIPKLVNLTVHHNAIRLIKPGALKGLGVLKHLDLSHNHILVINRGMLRGVAGLHVMDISNNLITSIVPNAFRAVRHLHMLQLSSNKLKTIQATAFQGLKNLRTLDITGNPIARIEAGAMRQARRLRQLSIDFFRIQIPDNSTFAGLRSLQTLDLHELGNAGFPNGLLKDSARLEKLIFTTYNSQFNGLSGKVFSDKLRSDRLRVEVSPFYDCTCYVPWIRSMTRLGAHVIGKCFNFAPITCSKYTA